MNSWTDEAIFHNGVEYFSDLNERISQAKSHIDIETYIFARDSAGLDMLRRLQKKAEEGVAVRIIVDGIGSRHWVYNEMIHYDGPPMESRVYHPVPWPFSRFILHELASFAKIKHLFSLANRRDHKKLILIDGEVAYIGLNISDTSLAWRETGVRVAGGDLGLLMQSFEASWKVALSYSQLYQFKTPKLFPASLPTSPLIRLSQTRKNRKAYRRLYLRRIQLARERIWLTVAYFIPPPLVFRALRDAARRGVDVRLLLAGQTDIWHTRWLSRMYFPSLLRAGVKIYEYQPTVLHAKSSLIDDWTCVGSSNLNYRSYYYDLELDISLTGAQACQALADQFVKDLESSSEVTSETLKKTRWWHVFVEKLVLLVKKWS